MRNPDWLRLVAYLRDQALLLDDEARRGIGVSHAKGMASGFRIAANAIARELGDPVIAECDFLCRCTKSRCTACDLRDLTHDLPALLKAADDMCCCEEGRQCSACGIAEVARKHLTLAHPAPAGTEADPVGRRGASEPQPDGADHA